MVCWICNDWSRKYFWYWSYIYVFYIGSSASQIMNPTDTTTYSVIVTDVCGQKEEASVEVSVIQYDPLLVDADRTYACKYIAQYA